MLDLLIKNGSCYIDKDLKNCDIAINDGKIIEIGKINSEAKEIYDASNLTVLPGCIDTQTHFREPGSTDTEDLHSGSRAAIAGGITSVFEMPNTNPPTSNKTEFQRKLDLAKNRMYCNYAFYFGATADNAKDLASLKNLVGCCGIKLFAGSSTGNLLVADEKDIETVFQNSSKVVAVHSEDEEILNINKKLINKGDVHSHPIWRSEECAISSTRRIVQIAERYNKKAHVLHITTKQEIDFLSQHKGNITFEITPQHLTIYAPDCYDKLGTYAQMNPPIRSSRHRDGLWEGLRDGTIDCIATDHAPHTVEEKSMGYGKAPSGMPGVETSLTLMLDQASRGNAELEDIVRWMSSNPASIYKAIGKGMIKEGADADITIVDLDIKKTIRNSDTYTKCGWSAFDGAETKGWPVMTIVNGNIVFDRGEFNDKIKGKKVQFS